MNNQSSNIQRTIFKKFLVISFYVPLTTKCTECLTKISFNHCSLLFLEYYLLLETQLSFKKFKLSCLKQTILTTLY